MRAKIGQDTQYTLYTYYTLDVLTIVQYEAVPDEGEDEPGHEEGGREPEQRPGPGEVDH